MTIEDIIEGNGSEYVLLAKFKGEYKIHSEAETISKLVDELQKIINKVKQKQQK